MSLDDEDTQMSITTQPDMGEECERGGGGPGPLIQTLRGQQLM